MWFSEEGKEGVSRCTLYPEDSDFPTPFLGWKWGGWTRCLLKTPLVHAYLAFYTLLSRFSSSWLIQRGAIKVRGGIWKEGSSPHSGSPFSKFHSHPARNMDALSSELKSWSRNESRNFLSDHWKSAPTHVSCFSPVPRDPVYNSGVHSLVKRIHLPRENRHSLKRFGIKERHKHKENHNCSSCSQRVNCQN